MSGRVHGRAEEFRPWLPGSRVDSDTRGQGGACPQGMLSSQPASRARAPPPLPVQSVVHLNCESSRRLSPSQDLPASPSLEMSYRNTQRCAFPIAQVVLNPAKQVNINHHNQKEFLCQSTSKSVHPATKWFLSSPQSQQSHWDVAQ